MKKFIIGLILVASFMLMNLRICQAEVSLFKPEWKIGDAWKVEFQHRDLLVPLDISAPIIKYEGPPEYENFSKPSFYIFKVTDIKRIEEEECFEVQVFKQENNKEKPLMYFYYTTDTLKLKATQEINENNTKGFLEYPDEKSGPVMDSFSLTRSLYFAWPDFTQLDPVNSPQLFKNTLQETTVEGDTLIIKWRLGYNAADGSYRSIREQIWKKGNLWWDEMKSITNEGETIKKAHSIFTSDSQPPQISLTVTPDTLWPANHQMVEITPNITVSDNQDPSPTVTLESVTSNEPDDAPGAGDGNTTGDIQVTPDGKIFLRAERDGKGTGRIYTITYTATDASGNKASASAAVTVPHSQGKDKK